MHSSFLFTIALRKRVAYSWTMKTIITNNIRGEEKNDCCVYRGVPYASVEKRFAPPVQLGPFSAVVDALSFSPMMPQPEQKKGSFYQREFHWFEEKIPKTEENSLVLNIWTPKGEGPFPVVVYIHGGAFCHGSASEVEFDGERWAEMGIILVTVQYRLGLLGFIALEGGKCNLGLRDQVAAYDWVYDNIPSFGGDRERISLMGQSAGGISIYSLLSSPYLEHRPFAVVLLSAGGIGEPLSILSLRREKIESLTKEFLDDRMFSMEDLLDMTPSSVIALEGEMTEYIRERAPSVSLPFSPLIDGDFLPYSFDEALRKGLYDGFPVLTGAVSMDLTQSPFDVENNKMLQSEGRFLSRRKGRSYQYFFSHPLPPDDTPAFHSADLWYVFRTLSRSWRGFGEVDFRISEVMMESMAELFRSASMPWKEYPSVKVF